MPIPILIRGRLIEQALYHVSRGSQSEQECASCGWELCPSALILVTASTWRGALAQGVPSREAPVGHRQPKAGEVPQEQELSPAEKNKKNLTKHSTKS